MTLFEALPNDITIALFSYCKDDECLNDATLRALRTELKLDKAEHNKYSHDCLRCDKFKEYKNEVELRVTELKEQIEKMKCCEMCKHKNLNWEFSPICEARDKITIENPLTCKCDKWSMRND